jgi:hypothetical protein
MERKEDREMLRKVGFAEVEMNHLSRLRRDYTESEKRRVLAEHRRLEFVRWLVSIGKITDQIA